MAAIFKGKARQFVREHNDRAWAVYHVALLGRVTRLPPLRRLMQQERSQKTPQSWQQMQELSKQWALRSGAVEIRSEPKV